MENVRARRNENPPRIIEPIRKYPSLEHLDTDEFFCKWESLNFDALIIR